MDIQQKLANVVEGSDLIGPGQRVLVLLSGGADSVCLLHLLRTEITNAPVGALHVNYGLRAEADEDEKFCRGLCEKLAVRLYTMKLKLAEKGNLQAEARNARYRLATECADGEGFDLIAVGHTASDQAETVLYRLVVSPGRKAILGMSPREGRIVRPLLAVSAADTRAYCEQLGLEWREDSSNAGVQFARNRIRNKIMPELKRIHPAAERNILATREYLADEATVLQEALAGALAQVGASIEVPSVEAERLAELPHALRRMVVRALAELAAGGELTPISNARLAAILSLATRGGSTSMDLGKVRVVCQYGMLRFVPAGGVVRHLEPVKLAVPGKCRFGSWLVSSKLVSSGSVQSVTAAGHDQATLDAELIGSEVLVRPWRDGDRIRPLGMSGTKSLQDVFTDQKVPRALRRRLPVVEASGEIAWVAGVATSDSFKLTNRSTAAVRLTAGIND